jgi:hypothetical protein
MLMIVISRGGLVSVRLIIKPTSGIGFWNSYHSHDTAKQ